MGALFSHLSRVARARPASASGARWASTRWRAAAAPALFGVLAVPALGPKLALLLIVPRLPGADRAARLVARRRSGCPRRPRWRSRSSRRRWRSSTSPTGGRVVSYREGVMAAVSVVEDADGVARLRINNRQQEGSSATFRVDARQAWLPLLLHPAPRRALFLGLGTGVTAASAADDPTLHVDAVELLPEVIDASAHFTARPATARRSRLHVMAADARRYVRASDARYDVIVSDNFHPARSGSGALYTVEHFEAVRRRLDARRRVLPVAAAAPARSRDLAQHRAIVPGGVSARLGHAREQQPGDTGARVWSRAVTRAASTSRRSAIAWRARRCRERAGRPRARRRARGARQLRRRARRRCGASPATPPPTPTIIRWWRTARRASPTRPIRARATGCSRCCASCRSSRDAADSAPRPIRRGHAAWPPTGRRATASSSRAATCDPRRACRTCWRRCASRCSSVLRISPDFRPAYDPLLSMATALARSDVSGARTLLTELARLQPARTEATRAAGASTEIGRHRRCRAELPEAERGRLPNVGERVSNPEMRRRSSRGPLRIRAAASRWPASCWSCRVRGCGRTASQAVRSEAKR